MARRRSVRCAAGRASALSSSRWLLASTCKCSRNVPSVTGAGPSTSTPVRTAMARRCTWRPRSSLWSSSAGCHPTIGSCLSGRASSRLAPSLETSSSAFGSVPTHGLRDREMTFITPCTSRCVKHCLGLSIASCIWTGMRWLSRPRESRGRSKCVWWKAKACRCTTSPRNEASCTSSSWSTFPSASRPSNRLPSRRCSRRRRTGGCAPRRVEHTLLTHDRSPLPHLAPLLHPDSRLIHGTHRLHPHRSLQIPRPRQPLHGRQRYWRSSLGRPPAAESSAACWWHFATADEVSGWPPDRPQRAPAHPCPPAPPAWAAGSAGPATTTEVPRWSPA
mmetsp:Transcript_24582/g.79082  ORF Transcript_24582/g.79082 Transcript_24582/m.79082 type:complete len:333 (-) Transcript_24582:223-1221(-)